MNQRLPREQYLALKAFKKKVRDERVGKFVKDHSGHIYKVDSNGSLRRLTREELLERSREVDSSNEPS
jgi:hypothetical protein